MKFAIKTSSFKKGLDVVNHATAQVTTTPILENILIKVKKGSVVLTANNLETAIEYVIQDDIDVSSEGAFCIPSKLFSSYISLLNDDMIEVELLDDESVKVLTSSGKFKVKGLPASDFPLIPNIKEESSFHIDGSTLKAAIDKTLFSCAEGNIRPTLAGILVHIAEKQVTFASTDSFRLSEYTTHIGGNDIENFHQIIPSKTTHQLKSIIHDTDSVSVITGENQIAFSAGNTKIFSRLLNGKFPDYSNFFPNTFSTKAEIDRGDLIQALKKINLISRENNYSIKMSFSPQHGILLETNETQIGEGDVQLSGAVEGEENVIGVNSTYFLQALEVMHTTHIEIRFESPLSPILVSPLKDPDKASSESESYKHIIMPLKI
ncbi:DNA polymerase III subunit beta [Candidatus Gracilibacteria bacterium]|nr:DNA polymerase III subunit beta [Candidatus Gracilibacteria bacterium]